MRVLSLAFEFLTEILQFSHKTLKLCWKKRFIKTGFVFFFVFILQLAENFPNLILSFQLDFISIDEMKQKIYDKKRK